MENQYAIASATAENLSRQAVPIYDMVVFCHLRWEFVYQRPQHVISRMARHQKVLYMEEPLHFTTEEENIGRLIEVTSNLHVLQPLVSGIENIKNILPQFVAREVATGWFYSASFVGLLDEFNFGTVVYDCMDELSLFKNAPQQLVEQEQLLLDNADVVFTGGKSLYESKKARHYNVHCFPSSVDRQHFSKALNGIAIPAELTSLGYPIVGYFGVIDERIDLELLRDTAALQPEVSFVMIGPLAKIHESDLPQSPNIHYLGMKPYERLPYYLKAFSIAMMPFALNDATRYISPTKTLEYMAAGRPIVSTPIKDVVRDYSDCVSIVCDAPAFSNAITALLTDAARDNRLHAYDDILEQTSWDSTVARMNDIIKISQS